MTALGIGSEVYIFDENRRVYPRDEKGHATGGCIYREHFRKVKITGETPRQWLAYYQKAFKKNPYETGFYTAEMVDEAVWDKENRYKIARAVEKVPTLKLKDIANLIGY